GSAAGAEHEWTGGTTAERLEAGERAGGERARQAAPGRDPGHDHGRAHDRAGGRADRGQHGARAPDPHADAAGGAERARAPQARAQAQRDRSARRGDRTAARRADRLPALPRGERDPGGPRARGGGRAASHEHASLKKTALASTLSPDPEASDARAAA